LQQNLYHALETTLLTKKLINKLNVVVWCFVLTCSCS